MHIGKPLLLVTTPVGLALGIYEGFRLTGGLVVLLVAMIGLFGAGTAWIIATIRRERVESQGRR
jgi:hypothetical protein